MNLVSPKPIFLDAHSTTKTDPRVLDAMIPWFIEKFGNPSSNLNSYGWESAAAIELSKRKIATLADAPIQDAVVFTSCATESNHLAILGLLKLLKSKNKTKILTTKIEHSSVLGAVSLAAEQGFEIVYVKTESTGRIDLNDLKNQCDEKAGLVSIAWANHEVGTIQPVAEIAEICRNNDIIFHSDAVQAFGKIPLDAKSDFISVSAHKIYGPKGCGALVFFNSALREKIAPLQKGGQQEYALRPGTENVPAIVGFGVACEIAKTEMIQNANHMRTLRDFMWQSLSARFGSRIQRNGSIQFDLPHNLNISASGVDGAAWLSQLKNVAISNASSCLSGVQDYSQVLMELGLTKEMARASIRIGLSHDTAMTDVSLAVKEIGDALDRLIQFENMLGSNL